MEIELLCPRCGSALIEAQGPDGLGLTDDDIYQCTDCGHEFDESEADMRALGDGPEAEEDEEAICG